MVNNNNRDNKYGTSRDRNADFILDQIKSMNSKRAIGYASSNEVSLKN